MLYIIQNEKEYEEKIKEFDKLFGCQKESHDYQHLKKLYKEILYYEKNVLKKKAEIF